MPSLNQGWLIIKAVSPKQSEYFMHENNPGSATHGYCSVHLQVPYCTPGTKDYRAHFPYLIKSILWLLMAW